MPEPSAQPPLPNLPHIEAPQNLFVQVLTSIQGAQLKRIKYRLFATLTTCIASIAGIIFYAPALWREITTSSFFEFIRLAISDPDILFGNMKDLLLGLLEALPIDGLIFGLLTAFLVVGTCLFAQALYRERHPRTKSLISWAR